MSREPTNEMTFWTRIQKEARRAVGRNLFTTLALLSSGLAVWFVPQVRNILLHLPVAVDWGDTHYLVSWTLYTLLLVPLYFTVGRWVVDPRTEPKYTEYFKPLCVAAAILAVLHMLPPVATWMHRVTPGPIPAYLLVAGAAAVLAPSALKKQLKRLRMPVALYILLAAIVILFMIYGRWVQAVLLPLFSVCTIVALRYTRQKPTLHGSLLRFVCLSLMLFFAIGEFTWLLPEIAPGWWSYHTHTVWALYQAFFTVIALAHILDFGQRTVGRDARRKGQPISVRALGVVAVLLLCLFLQSVSVGEASDRSKSTVTNEWFTALEQRLKYMDDQNVEGPVILLAASGGGSRAAMFTALSLEALSEAPGLAKDLHDRILITSSVSGGSLAVAYYLAHRYAGSEPRHKRSKWIRAIRSEVDYWVRENAKLAGVSSADRKATKDEAEPRGAPAWIMKSQFIDDMGASFMAPLLRGMYIPWYERGEATSAFWRDTFKWDGLSNFTWAKKTEDTAPPLAIFNATNVESGLRLAIGFPSLPPQLSSKAATTLSKLDLTCKLTLDEAVRCSANFPWGFCAPILRAGPGISVSDGGVVDNTGLDSICMVFEALGDLAQGTSDIQERAKNTLDKIRNRGVLLLVIDSGVNPTPRRGIGLVFPELTEPVRALSNTDAAKAQSWTQVAIELLKREFGENTVLPHEVAYHNEQHENVMTAWSLGPRDKASLIHSFVVALDLTTDEKTGLVSKTDSMQILLAAVETGDEELANAANAYHASLEDAAAIQQDRLKDVRSREVLKKLPEIQKEAKGAVKMDERLRKSLEAKRKGRPHRKPSPRK
jgi:hypothetical protein